MIANDDPFYLWLSTPPRKLSQSTAYQYSRVVQCALDDGLERYLLQRPPRQCVLLKSAWPHYVRHMAEERPGSVVDSLPEAPDCVRTRQDSRTRVPHDFVLYLQSCGCALSTATTYRNVVNAFLNRCKDPGDFSAVQEYLRERSAVGAVLPPAWAYYAAWRETVGESFLALALKPDPAPLNPEILTVLRALFNTNSNWNATRVSALQWRHVGEKGEIANPLRRGAVIPLHHEKPYVTRLLALARAAVVHTSAKCYVVPLTPDFPALPRPVAVLTLELAGHGVAPTSRAKARTEAPPAEWYKGDNETAVEEDEVEEQSPEPYSSRPEAGRNVPKNVLDAWHKRIAEADAKHDRILRSAGQHDFDFKDDWSEILEEGEREYEAQVAAAAAAAALTTPTDSGWVDDNDL